MQLMFQNCTTILCGLRFRYPAWIKHAVYSYYLYRNSTQVQSQKQNKIKSLHLKGRYFKHPSSILKVQAQSIWSPVLTSGIYNVYTSQSSWFPLQAVEKKQVSLEWVSSTWDTRGRSCYFSKKNGKTL